MRATAFVAAVALAALCLVGAVQAALNDGQVTGPLVGDTPITRIVHGHPVTSVSTFPWYMAMRRPFVCGGALISPNHVLTAAHCVDGQSASSFQFMYGCTSTTSSSCRTRTASAATRHPYFSWSTFDYDFAIVTLSSAVTDVAPVTLISTPIDTIECPCSNATVMGYGTTSSGGPQSSQLLAADMHVVTNSECQAGFPNDPVTDRMVCAGDMNALTDACQGDSGGPLVVMFWLDANGTMTQHYGQIGVVSWGIGCAEPGLYGVYSRVSSVIGGIRAIISGNSQGWLAPNEYVSPTCPSQCSQLRNVFDATLPDPVVSNAASPGAGLVPLLLQAGVALASVALAALAL